MLSGTGDWSRACGCRTTRPDATASSLCVEEAAKEEQLKHLLRTPLQVLIMSIIAESSRRFSPSRFALFWGYYTDD